jgi:hypothetical protein
MADPSTNADDTTAQTIEAQLIALVRSEQVEERRSAVQALARLEKTPRVFELLMQLVLDDDGETRRTAANALRAFGSTAGEKLVRRLSDPEVKPPARLRIGLALAELGDPRPGVGIRPNGLPDIDWVEVPAGEFIYQDDERVYLDTFEIARYLVTYIQFQVFIEDPEGFANAKWWRGPARRKTRPGNQRWKIANHPRENVGWYDAMAFCRWLSAQLGEPIRLPTEREWEKAARGTDGRTYPWGEAFDSTKCNVRETELWQTSAVGIFPQGTSPYGVLDMSGNVWEWCLNEYDKPEDIDPENEYAWRALRGGSWSFDCPETRDAVRVSIPNRNHVRGFRLVRGLPSSQKLIDH